MKVVVFEARGFSERMRGEERESYAERNDGGDVEEG